MKLNFTEAAAIVLVLCSMDEIGLNEMGPTAKYLVDRLLKAPMTEEEIGGALDLLIARAAVLKERPRVSAREVEVQMRRAIKAFEHEGERIFGQSV